MESKEDTEDIEETEGARLGVNSGVRIDFELAGVLGILLVVLMM
jgi:propanediol utilization protein